MTPTEARTIMKLPATATPVEIKSRYRLLSLAAHPDGGGSAREFGLLKQAYDVLSGKLTGNEAKAEKARLLRDLKAVLQQIEIATARAGQMAAGDFRIKAMLAPLEERKASIEAGLAGLS